MKSLVRAFLRGLAVLLPITITIYVLWWLAATAEAVFGAGLRLVLPEGAYRPGLGVAAGVLLAFGLGIAMNLWITRALVGLGEGLLTRVPLVKTLYGSVKDLMGFFSGDGKQELDQVVLVRFGEGRFELLGFLTNDDLESIAAGLGEDGRVAVYLPMSYQVGGFTVMVPRSAVVPVALSVEQGMRYAMTAFMSKAARR